MGDESKAISYQPSAFSQTKEKNSILVDQLGINMTYNLLKTTCVNLAESW
jgi:hypothetical protein